MSDHAAALSRSNSASIRADVHTPIESDHGSDVVRPAGRRSPAEISVRQADAFLPLITRDAVKEKITEVSTLRDAAATQSKTVNARKNTFLRWMGFEGKLPIPGIAGAACAVAATVIVAALVGNPITGPIAAGVGIGVLCVVGAIALWRMVAAHRAQKEANLEPKTNAATAETELANLVRQGRASVVDAPADARIPVNALDVPTDGRVANAGLAGLRIRRVAAVDEVATPAEALQAQSKIDALKVEKGKQFKRVAMKIGVVCGVTFVAASIGAGAMTGVVPAFVIGVFVTAVLIAGISLAVAAVKRYMNDKHTTEQQIATQELLIHAANDSKGFPSRADVERENNARRELNLRREFAAALRGPRAPDEMPPADGDDDSSNGDPTYARVRRANLPSEAAATHYTSDVETDGLDGLPGLARHNAVRHPRHVIMLPGDGSASRDEFPIPTYRAPPAYPGFGRGRGGANPPMMSLDSSEPAFRGPNDFRPHTGEHLTFSTAGARRPRMDTPPQGLVFVQPRDGAFDDATSTSPAHDRAGSFNFTFPQGFAMHRSVSDTDLSQPAAERRPLIVELPSREASVHASIHGSTHGSVHDGDELALGTPRHSADLFADRGSHASTSPHHSDFEDLDGNASGSLHLVDAPGTVNARRTATPPQQPHLAVVAVAQPDHDAPVDPVDPNIQLGVNLAGLLDARRDDDAAALWITADHAFRTSPQTQVYAATAAEAADNHLRQKIALIPCIANRGQGADLPADYVQRVNAGLTAEERLYIQSLGRDVNAYIPAQPVADDHAARPVVLGDAAPVTPLNPQDPESWIKNTRLRGEFVNVADNAAVVAQANAAADARMRNRIMLLQNAVALRAARQQDPIQFPRIYFEGLRTTGIAGAANMLRDHGADMDFMKQAASDDIAARLTDSELAYIASRGQTVLDYVIPHEDLI